MTLGSLAGFHFADWRLARVSGEMLILATGFGVAGFANVAFWRAVAVLADGSFLPVFLR